MKCVTFKNKKEKKTENCEKKSSMKGRYYCHIFIYTKSKTFNLCSLYFYMHLFFHLWIRKKTTPMCFIPTNCKIFNQIYKVENIRKKNLISLKKKMFQYFCYIFIYNYFYCHDVENTSPMFFISTKWRE